MLAKAIVAIAALCGSSKWNLSVQRLRRLMYTLTGTIRVVAVTVELLIIRLPIGQQVTPNCRPNKAHQQNSHRNPISHVGSERSVTRSSLPLLGGRLRRVMQSRGAGSGAKQVTAVAKTRHTSSYAYCVVNHRDPEAQTHVEKPACRQFLAATLVRRRSFVLPFQCARLGSLIVRIKRRTEKQDRCNPSNHF